MQMPILIPILIVDADADADGEIYCIVLADNENAFAASLE